MDSCSWSDAEEYCKIDNGHLWSINSYFEWWHLYNAFNRQALTKTHGEDLNLEFPYLLSTVLIFIGLQVDTDSHNKVI